MYLNFCELLKCRLEASEQFMLNCLQMAKFKTVKIMPTNKGAVGTGGVDL